MLKTAILNNHLGGQWLRVEVVKVIPGHFIGKYEGTEVRFPDGATEVIETTGLDLAPHPGYEEWDPAGERIWAT